MLFGCFFNSHFVFVSGKHISFLNACAFGFAVITSKDETTIPLEAFPVKIQEMAKVLVEYENYNLSLIHI